MEMSELALTLGEEAPLELQTVAPAAGRANRAYSSTWPRMVIVVRRTVLLGSS
jgi:hypothetical protein